MTAQSAAAKPAAAKPAVVLAIAGFDPTGGAGVAADGKTIAAHGAYAVSVVTAVAVQTTRELVSVEPIPPAVLRAQLEAVLTDLPVSAVKIGMLANAEGAEAVASALEQFHPPNIVLDPVLRSSSGAELLDPEGVEVLKSRLLPLADVVTPNRAEAAQLTGVEPGAKDAIGDAAWRLWKAGAKAVVITGGDADKPADWLFDGRSLSEFTGEKVRSENTHGTGCAFSSAIAVHLAGGKPLPDAVVMAKAYVAEAIRKGIPFGDGKGLLNHFHRFDTGDRSSD